MNRPKTKQQCIKMLMDSMPPLDHKHGYFRATAERYAERWRIPASRMWKHYGVNTAMRDRKSGEIVYYPEDIARAMRGALNKTWVDIEEWN